jgi:hypothetical protein
MTDKQVEILMLISFICSYLPVAGIILFIALRNRAND